MPHYALVDVKALIAQGQWDVVTEKCRNRIRDMGHTQAQVLQFILDFVTEDDCQGPFRETCWTDVGDVEADYYLTWGDLDEWARTKPGIGTKFYIKLGIATDAQGDFCAVVSFHPSNSMYFR